LLVLFVFGHALRLAQRLVQPISHAVHLDRLGSVAGIDAGTLLAVGALVLVSFAAGMAARTTHGGRVSRWFEDSLIGGMPQYRMVKTMAEGFAQLENANSLKPVLVSIEGGWQIGYLLEPIAEGWVGVFMPTAPTPMSGTVMYLPADRVRLLNITLSRPPPLLSVSASDPAKHCGA
jgi:uncharacterized membrane protein